MVGAAGFEPAHDGIKTRCLTAWLRPNRQHKSAVYFLKSRFIASKFFLKSLATKKYRKKTASSLPKGKIFVFGRYSL